MKKYELKDNTMIEFQTQRVYNYSIYPRDSRIHSDKRFVNLDNGSQGGTQWNYFIVKDNKSYYFDSFGGQPDNFSLKQLPKSIIYQSYRFQDMNSKFCGWFCLYSFHWIARMKRLWFYFDTRIWIFAIIILYEYL